MQPDLGTTSIFILLHTAMLYLATEKRRVLVLAAGALVLAALTGYSLIDVVRVRLEVWLNPWNDPSGNSYKIIQSLLSIANGGVFGPGPGIGTPGLAPVAHSDFIYSSIAEETGTLGALGLLGLYSFLLARGVIVALQASERFYRCWPQRSLRTWACRPCS